jgi:hypothetical protein
VCTIVRPVLVRGSGSNGAEVVVKRLKRLVPDTDQAGGGRGDAVPKHANPARLALDGPA